MDISLSIITFIILISIPIACTKGLPNHYKECSQPFSCGPVTNITYPFWGGVRPQHCGYPHHGFMIKCSDDQNKYPIIRMEALDFYIFDVDTYGYSMRAARVDTWDVCSVEMYINTSLEYEFFDFDRSKDKDLILFYRCSNVSDSNLAPYKFSCKDGQENYYAPLDMNVTGTYSCEAIVKMRVLNSNVKKLMAGKAQLQDVLNNGFYISYSDQLTNCTQCRQSNGVCGSDPENSHFVCYCKNGAHPLLCPKNEEPAFEAQLKIILGVLLAVGSVIICFLNRRRANSIQFWRSRTSNEKDLDAYIENFGPLPLRRYHFSEVKKMTYSFRDQLGEGAYGSVYRGKLPDNQRPVAVKLLNPAKGRGEEFINEVASISRTSHVNIVGLLGYCLEGDRRALIYEFLPNGSLEKFINKDSPKNLKWEKLYQIAVGIARGLEYLHRGCSTRILHFDIKPHNILLDEHFCPKVSDFGLSKLCTKNESIVSVVEARGTVGYIAPELFSRNFGDVSHKSDVYSYGMMILEMVGRRKSSNFGVSHDSEVYFPQWIYNQLIGGQDLQLPGVVTREDSEIAMKMIIVGLWCIQSLPADRPSMNQVIEMLEGSIRALQFPPKPFMSSPEKSPSVRVSGTFSSTSTLTGSRS